MTFLIKAIRFVGSSVVFIVRVFAGGYRNAKISYSQYGEDLIISGVFAAMKISKPSYLDIGANDPVSLNNTYLFYRQGCSGVLVEPDPGLHMRLRMMRKRDTCLNAGIGTSACERANFYIMSSSVLNTFCEEEARRYESYGTYKIKRVVQVPLLNVNDVIDAHFVDHPNLVSLDVEGLDKDILRAFDFKKYRPEVFCVETLAYSEDKTGAKEGEILEIMEANGYAVYADTNLNTIFVDRRAWANR